jgi:hypothetical protein
MRNIRAAATFAIQFALTMCVTASDDTGIGSWPQVGTGWPDNTNGIEAIHLIQLPTNQLLVWEVANWEDHEHRIDTIFSLGNMFCAGYVPGPDKSEWTIGFDVTGPYIQISAPGNNRVAPPGWYMLFIMKKTTVANWNNRVEYVPSAAKYVRIISPIEGG